MLNPYDFYITPEEYEIAAQNGICKRTLESRIRTLGWDKKTALTKKVQQRTRINESWIKIAELNGIKCNTLKSRVYSLGWAVEVAATKPLQSKEDRIKILESKKRKYPKEYLELARKNGIKEETFRYRVRHCGWSLNDAAVIPILTQRQSAKLSELIRNGVSEDYKLKEIRNMQIIDTKKECAP